MIRKDKKRQEEKTNQANKIGKQSKVIKNIYAFIKKIFLWLFRWISYFIDHVLFNVKYTKVVALALAIITYVVVNYNSLASLYSASIKTARDKPNVEIIAEYDSDNYELIGLPETADVTIIGDATSVTSAYNSNGAIVANLSEYTEGTYEVALTSQNFGNNVSLKIEPSTVTITLKKKITQSFAISYDFVNKDKMESIYTLGTPTFDINTVEVKASQDTLNNIAFIRALIDVTNANADFEQDATLVAYNAEGQVVNAEIEPSTVHVSVPVSSASKSVALELRVVGDIPNDQAIDTVKLSQENIIVYGSESALANLNSIPILLDGTTLSESGEYNAKLELPDGITCPNISDVKVNITLNQVSHKTIENVVITFKYDKKYKATAIDGTTSVNVTVIGTNTNIENISENDIDVYINLKNVKEGTQTLELQVDQPTGGLIKYELSKTSLEMNIESK